MQKRFVSWAAVSSLPQAKKISLTEQREINLRHIQRHDGIMVADLIVDESRDIPELSEACERIEAYRILRELIKTGGCDVVICYTRSRLGRVAAMVETIAELCRRANVTIYETDTPPSNLERAEGDGELLSGMVRSWKAQSEVDELRRRHRMGMLGKLKKGEFLNGVPFGWRTAIGSDGKPVIEVDPVAAKTIRCALIDLYLNQGWGSYYIADELNARGMLTTTGLKWTHESLVLLFRMKWRYAGWGEINVWSKDRPYSRAKGNWPPIITEEELHLLIAEQESRKGARGRAKVYRLSLICWCATCQKRMIMKYVTHHHSRLSGKVCHYTYVNAVCPKGTHDHKAIPVTRILKDIRALFIHLQDRSNWAPYLQDTDIDTRQIDVQAASIDKEIRKAEQAILETDDKLIDGTFDTTRHAHQVQRLKARIAGLQNELTVLHDHKLTLERASQRQSRLEEIARHGLSYLDMEDEQAANTLLRRLIRVDLAAGQVINITLL